MPFGSLLPNHWACTAVAAVTPPDQQCSGGELDGLSVHSVFPFLLVIMPERVSLATLAPLSRPALRPLDAFDVDA
jgi:hypothetical protein